MTLVQPYPSIEAPHPLVNDPINNPITLVPFALWSPIWSSRGQRVAVATLSSFLFFPFLKLSYSYL